MAVFTLMVTLEDADDNDEAMTRLVDGLEQIAATIELVGGCKVTSTSWMTDPEGGDL